MLDCKYCNRKFNNARGLLVHQSRTHRNQHIKEHGVSRVRIQSNYYDDLLDITNDELRELRAIHSGVCDVCGKVETSNTRPDAKSTCNNLCIDHDHSTKEFRGFLCVQCNRNFGWYDKYKSKIHEHEKFMHRGIPKNNTVR